MAAAQVWGERWPMLHVAGDTKQKKTGGSCAPQPGRAARGVSNPDGRGSEDGFPGAGDTAVRRWAGGKGHACPQTTDSTSFPAVSSGGSQVANATESGTRGGPWSWGWGPEGDPLLSFIHS